MDPSAFVEDVTDFECSICYGVLSNPKVCKCGNSFCHDCMVKCLKDKGKCPICEKRQEIDNLYPNLIVKKIINSKDVTCSNKAIGGLGGSTSNNSRIIGCDWIGKLDRRNAHLAEECLYAEVKCTSQGCIFTDKRYKMEKHQKRCEYRYVTCKACSCTEIILRDFHVHRITVCRVTCLLCGTMGMTPRDLARHKARSCRAIGDCDRCGTPDILYREMATHRLNNCLSSTAIQNPMTAVTSAREESELRFKAALKPGYLVDITLGCGMWHEGIVLGADDKFLYIRRLLDEATHKVKFSRKSESIRRKYTMVSTSACDIQEYIIRILYCFLYTI